MIRGYGFLLGKLEIKVLILYIMHRLYKPITLEDLLELTLCEDGISYFDVMESIIDLVKTEHLCLEEDVYTITDKGIRNGKTTENSLPISLRANAENAALKFRRGIDRNTMIKTLQNVKEDGSRTVTLSLSDGISEVISLEIMALSERQALELEDGFRKNAENVFNTVIETILGDRG